MTICLVILNVNLISINTISPILIYYYKPGIVFRLYNPIILCTKLSWCHLLVSRTLLPYKLIACVLSDAYVSWWRSYLTSPYFAVPIHNFYSTHFELLSSDHQGSLLGSILFNAFINDLCNSIKHSRFFLFADNINIFRTVSSVTDNWFHSRLECRKAVWNFILTEL